MTSTNSSQPTHSRVEELIARSASLPAAERDVFLSHECGDDVALRQQIYEYLLAEAKGEAHKKLSGKPGPVTSAVNQALAGSAHDRRVELLGKVLGDYRLTAILGAGGVGTVYLGERADRAYSAQVAIKVVANSHLNQEVQRRFAGERQILANLNHPYIGRLLDAGETFFDEPFLVMEYVHGEAMDRYCNNQRLSVAERIQLFLQVCEAVQYAHRNLIVHRDLKPGNILVSKEGTPKLLDFGIAKLLDESAQVVLQEGIIAHTRVHDRLLTPEYASPEQIRGQPVTTASDVYSLGVILYELLTGVRPYLVNAQNQLELERSICIQDPLKPSQMAIALSKDSSTAHPLVKDASLIPIARKTTFPKLTTQLSGDLDAIVMKALRKEPEHRYSSVEHLMDDLNRHLHQEPVQARQGNRWYYTQRFIKRHTLGVISATTALAALITVAIILSIQAKQLKEQRDIATQQRDKATQESKRAETVSNFMLDVFTAADPFQSQDKQVTAKELLDKAANKIETSLNDQPEVKARLLEAIGEAYLNQGQYDTSVQYLKSALTTLKEKRSQDNSIVLPILNHLGQAYMETGDLNSAQDVLNEALTFNDGIKEQLNHDLLQTLINCGALANKQGRLQASQRYYEEGLRVSRQVYGDNSVGTADVLMSLAQVMTWQSKYEEAQSISSEAIQIYEKKLPPRHPNLLIAKLGLSETMMHLGRLTDAEKLLTQVLDDQKALFGPASPQLINTYNTLAKLQISQNSTEVAKHTIQTGIEIAKTLSLKQLAMRGVLETTLATALLKEGKYAAAAEVATDSLKMLRQSLASDHQYISSAEYVLGAALVGQHKANEAEHVLLDNIARWTRTESAAWRTARSESLLGVALAELHKSGDAATALKHSYEVLSTKDNGADSDVVAIAKKRLEEFSRCEAEHRLDKCELPI